VEPEERRAPRTREATNSAHRRAQGAPQACVRVQDFQALSAAAMDACCPANGGGHRRLQASCGLPAACPSAACAAVFVPYMRDCATMLAATPGVPVADFESFAASCAEMQAGADQMLQPVAVQMFRVLVSTESAAQSGGMFPGGGKDDGGASQPLDPLQPLAPVPPPPPDATEGVDETGVTQYHAVCTSADVASCVPACNAEHHGYELLATIDGTDTKFSCNLAHGLYSWMGAASEGGYLGADAQSFFSAVVSGAAGSYIVTLTQDAGISTDLMIQPGQDVHISGLPSLAAAPSWGSGGFTVTESALLWLSNLQVSSIVGVAPGGAVAFDSVSIFGGTTVVGSIVRSGTTGMYTVSPEELRGMGLPSWDSTNVNGHRYALFRMPPQRFAGPGRSSEQVQEYADTCAAAGLQPVVTGDTSRGAPDYCARWDCLQTEWDEMFMSAIGTQTGWVHGCDPNVHGVCDGDCIGPTLVAFTPGDNSLGELQGGTYNSVGGWNRDVGWGDGLRALCGRLL
jgi:hypothetical protein